MKFVLLALCIIAVSVNGHPQNHHSEFAIKSLNECLTESEIKAEEFLALKEKKDPKVHCIGACVLRKKEILLSDGTIDKEAASVYIKNIFEESEQDNALEVLDTCIAEGKDEKDICTEVNNITHCFHEKLFKAAEKSEE